MTFEIAFVLGVLVVALVLFVRGTVPPDGVGIGIVVVLLVGGQLGPKEAFGAFGNEALVTVASMFVLAAGLQRTGALAFVGRRILRFARGDSRRVLVALMLAAALFSAFVNNTPIVVVFLPIALGLARATGDAPSKLLIPLAYATIAGGMCTLIGTSTNVLVSSLLPTYGVVEMHLFEPLPLAGIGTLVTLLYLATIGRRLLPVRHSVAAGTEEGRIVDYVTQLEIPPGSPLIGRSLEEALGPHFPEVRVLQVIRGEEIVDPDESLRLRADDALLLKGDVERLVALQYADGLALARELVTPAFFARRRDVTLAELLVRPPSTAIGERVRDLNLHSREGLAVLAVQRHGYHIRERVPDLRLRVGDILLVQAESHALEQLRDARNFLLLETPGDRVTLPHRGWRALAIMAVVILLATLELPRLPISVLALAGAGAMVAVGCLGLRDAYRAVDLPILVLIAGTITLGLALDQSGAARWIAHGLTRGAAPLGDVGVLATIYLVTSVLTAVISNNGAALLMLPIGLETAAQTGMDPTPFVLAVMFAASIDFSTPIGYQVNTIVYGPGGYRFSDYVKIGVPLNAIWWVLATLLIPVFWPLRPGS